MHTGRLIRRSLAIALTTGLMWMTHSTLGQDEPVNGMRPVDLRTHAITGATVVVAPGQSLDDATIVMRDGVIVAVGDVDVPASAQVWDASGLTVYPGLIDAAVLVKADALPESDGAHWNSHVIPQVTLDDQTAPTDNVRKDLRSLGFTAAAVYPEGGIFRGSGTVVALSDDDRHVSIYAPRAAMAVGMGRGRGFGGGYPGSLMGSIALIRQTLVDARWHAECQRIWQESPAGNEPPARADALAALGPVIAGDQTVLFDTSDEHNAVRAGAIAREFDLDLMILGSGMEFRRLREITALNAPVIAPVMFPKRPDLTSVSAIERVTLRELMTWEQAPTNVRRLVDADIPVAITTHRLRKRSDLPDAMRTAMSVGGLSADDALAALTTTPAALLGCSHLMGTIEPGKLANLVVLDGELFAKKSTVRDVWVNGRRHEINAAPVPTLAGTGTLETSLGIDREVTIDTGKKSFSVALADDERIKAKKVSVTKDQISIVVDATTLDETGFATLSGVVHGDRIIGSGVLPDGRGFTFTLRDIVETDETDETDDDTITVADGFDDAADMPNDDANGDDANADLITGNWSLAVSIEGMSESFPINFDATLNGDGTLSGNLLVMGEQELDFDGGEYDPDEGTFSATVSGPDGEDVLMQGVISGTSMAGSIGADQFAADFTGERTDDAAPEIVATANNDDSGDEEEVELPPEELVYPLGAYGLATPAEQQTVILENATIWTCGPDGIIEGGSMLIKDGKVAGIYRTTPDRSRIPRIDCTGKHITPGLIDCHSHTGISGGVNEMGQTNTAEVRIGDVVNPDDVSWYRQLAGGLTAANQLHGSANPIGGQNSVVKIRWGGSADDFRIDDAIPGIKFALGENVKRSSNRYPDTRMGVETFIRDAFTAANDYRATWDRYMALGTEVRDRTMPPRRDMEMETLIEILDGDRLVHCHSYRQDEILMLIRVADDFGFTIGTFQHVLEGYKVADAIAEHGAGGSSFSDWWAYKVEVMDAIPYNGAIMTDVGVLVSFNSDSNELARRMNTEASKAVRYGGMDPHEALKLVTLNPAKQLRIDDRTGSLERGKDADFAIWSGDPLSTYTRCEQTWVDGTRVFSLDDDARLRDWNHSERQRLIQKVQRQAMGKPRMADAGADAAASEFNAAIASPLVPEWWKTWALEQVRLGADPTEMAPAACGCGVHMYHGHHH